MTRPRQRPFWDGIRPGPAFRSWWPRWWNRTGRWLKESFGQKEGSRGDLIGGVRNPASMWQGTEAWWVRRSPEGSARRVMITLSSLLLRRLDLRRQVEVEAFFLKERPEYVFPGRCQGWRYPGQQHLSSPVHL